jgi:glycosyltransferase involved in cell wall biosynthesis
MMRVLLVAAATATDGGGENHVADLLKRLPSAGVDVALAAPAGGDLGELAASLGVDAFDAPIRRAFSVGAVLTLRRTIQLMGPDIVHAHGSRAAAFARAADPLSRERVVYTVHGIHADHAGSPARQTVFLGIERLLRPRTACFVAVCRSDAEKGARLGLLDPLRTTVLHNGIEFPPGITVPGGFRAEIGVDGRAPLVLSIGRFHEQKDQMTLLRAWTFACPAHPDAVLALIGSGAEDGRLRAFAISEGIGDRVRFARPRADLAPAYTDADLFVLSSRWEGLPYVVLEAMAYGLPVVSTGVDGIPEAVHDGQTGLLVPALDPQALGDALSRLIASLAERSRMGEAGRARVRAEFSLDRMVDGIVGVYREVARGSGVWRA